VLTLFFGDQNNKKIGKNKRKIEKFRKNRRKIE
jgi:hypothetical protein